MNALMNNEFTKWFMICVTQKFADFNGRSRRKEYWMFVLVAIIINIVLSVIENMIGLTIAVSPYAAMGILSSLFGLALLVPNIAAGVRRLHDTGKSGWFMLLGLIPFINLYLLYLLIVDSKPGENQYGPNPKGM